MDARGFQTTGANSFNVHRLTATKFEQNPKITDALNALKQGTAEEQTTYQTLRTLLSDTNDHILIAACILDQKGYFPAAHEIKLYLANQHYHQDAILALGSDFSQGNGVEANSDTAIGYFSKINTAESNKRIGHIYWEMRNHEQAFLYFTQSAELNSNDPETFLMLAKTCGASGHIDAAEGYLAQALKLGSETKL